MNRKVVWKDCPEHEKMEKIKDKSQIIGDFISWLRGKYEIAQWGDNDDNLYPTHKTTENILAQYFEIDLDRIEREKCWMIERIRNANAKT